MAVNFSEHLEEEETNEVSPVSTNEINLLNKLDLEEENKTLINKYLHERRATYQAIYKDLSKIPEYLKDVNKETARMNNLRKLIQYIFEEEDVILIRKFLLKLGDIEEYIEEDGRQVDSMEYVKDFIDRFINKITSTNFLNSKNGADENIMTIKESLLRIKN